MSFSGEHETSQPEAGKQQSNQPEASRQEVSQPETSRELAEQLELGLHFFRSQQPILEKIGFIAFSVGVFSLWTITLFIFTKELNFTVDKDVLLSVTGSSVELGALTLAILGLLLELNQADKWFKISLLFVAFLFISVVVIGLYSAVTVNKEAFRTPQHVNITLIVLIGGFTVIQFLLAIVTQLVPFVGRLSKDWWLVIIPFAVPIIIPISIVGLNTLSATLLLFGGALISLVVLAVVTSLSIAFRRKESSEVIKVLKSLQMELSQKGVHQPDLIPIARIIDRLRANLFFTPERLLRHEILSLVNEGNIYQDSAKEHLWSMPEPYEVEKTIKQIMVGVDLFIFLHTAGIDDAVVYFEGKECTKLIKRIQEVAFYPQELIRTYFLPFFFHYITNSEAYVDVKSGDWVAFIKKSWDVPKEIELSEKNILICSNISTVQFMRLDYIEIHNILLQYLDQRESVQGNYPPSDRGESRR